VTEIQQNRWDQLIRRVANVVGGGSQVNDTLNELFPVMDVENVPGELLALMGTRLGWCSSILQPTVGNRNHHQLFNPVDSGTLLAVTTVTVQANSAQYMRLDTRDTALTTLVGNERRRDTRTGVDADTTGQNRTLADTSNGGLAFRIRVLANEQEYVTDSNGVIILFPGTGLVVSTEATNVQSVISFMWRERTFEPAEVNF